jgi:hypothetical protein
MDDDLLRERLASYAAHGEEAAGPPQSTAIRRRARRLYGRRALTVTLVALVALAGVYVIRGMLVRELPAVRPAPPAPGPAPARGPLPPSFVADSPRGLVVASTATGKVIRVLAPPLPADTSLGTLGRPYQPVVSGDRSTVYYGGDCTGQRGAIYRRPLAGGHTTKVADGSGIALTGSADGTRLAWVDQPCVYQTQERVTVRDLDGGTQRHWTIPAGVYVGGLALSPDGGRLAMLVARSGQPTVQLRTLDLTRSGSVLDGRVLTLPDTGCEFTQAAQVAYRPGFGQLAVVERCRADAPDQLRLLYLDPASGAQQARHLVFHGGSTTVGGLDFDRSGSHLIYVLVEQDPPDFTWRYSDGGSVRIGEGYRNPSW